MHIIRTAIGLSTLLVLFSGMFATFAAADCGPGPLVLKRKSMLFQSLGATTNATLLPTQTVAITVGTSGCSSSGVVQARKDAEAFVASNADPLERDLARGHGPYLLSMSTLLGCAADKRTEFARTAQATFAGLTASAEQAPAVWLAQFTQGLAREPALAGTCRLLS